MSLFALDRVRFKHILAIDHLELPENRTTVIVGKSGSGKSTLMRLLNRMITPDEGSVCFRGVSLDEINPVELRRRVVMLPQNPIIFDGTIRENVLKGLEFSERPAIGDDRIRELLQLMQIHQLPDDRASRLSGGERQRVAIARVLAMQPEVLLLDEPSSALDDSTQDIVIHHVIEEAQRGGTRVVMVTHAREIAAEFGELVIGIEAGHVADIREQVKNG